MVRKPKGLTRRYNLLLRPEMAEAIERLAEQEDRDVAGMMRVLLAEALLARGIVPVLASAAVRDVDKDRGGGVKSEPERGASQQRGV